MNCRIVTLTALGALLLGACSSNNATLVKRAEVINKHQTDAVEKTIAVTPHWFTNIPQEPEAVYSVGTSISGDLQFSVDKAILNAKVALADRINGKLSASQKSFIAETTKTTSGTGLGILQENERAVKNVLANVAVTGYNVHKSVIKRESTYYRTFVMLQFPLGDANDVLMHLVRRNNEIEAKIRSRKAFRQLDKDVNKVTAHDAAKAKVIVDELNAP